MSADFLPYLINPMFHFPLNQYKLFKFKIKKDEFTAVTDEGEFVTYKKPNKPYKITLNNKTDLTNVLSDLDGDKVDLPPRNESNSYIRTKGGKS